MTPVATFSPSKKYVPCVGGKCRSIARDICSRLFCNEEIFTASLVDYKDICNLVSSGFNSKVSGTLERVAFTRIPNRW